MNMWCDLLIIVDNLVLQEENDQIIWSFSSNGRFSVQSLYVVINHRGVVRCPIICFSCVEVKSSIKVAIFSLVIG